MPLSFFATNPLGWAPFADPKTTPHYSSGYTNRSAVVAHIMNGSYNGTIDWFANPSSRVSAHFAISKQGKIAQFVSVYDTAWANGAYYEDGQWYDPQGHPIDPPWQGMIPGVDPNSQTISVEHEGYSGDTWSKAMLEADTLLLQWLRSLFPPLQPYTVGHTLIGHCDISPYSKANCPGSGCNLQQLADLGNKAFDPLRVAKIPGPNNTVYRCGTGYYDYYYRSGRNGFYDLGYARSDETVTTDSLGSSCTIMKFERGVLKYIEGFGVQTALLTEIGTMGWTP